MCCSNRVFVLTEKYDTRYVRAEYREQTARAIVQERLDDGNWYDTRTVDKIHRLWQAPHDKEYIFQFLKSRSMEEYEGFQVVFLEDLTGDCNDNGRDNS